MTEKELKIMKVFSERLVDNMVKSGVNGLELSKKIRVSPQAVSSWITVKKVITPSSLVKLAKFFDVTTDYLLGLTDDKKR